MSVVTTALAALRTAVTAEGRATVAARIATWDVAEALFAYRAAVSPQGKEATDAWFLSAMTETHRKRDSVGNLLRAVEIRNGLSDKRKEATKDYPYDTMLTLAPADESPKGDAKAFGGRQQDSLIAKLAKQGTTNTKEARKVRNDIRGTAKRERASDADKQLALSHEIHEKVLDLLTRHNLTDVCVGIALANDYPVSYLKDAVVFIAAQKPEFWTVQTPDAETVTA